MDAGDLQEADAALAVAGYRHVYSDKRDAALRSLSLHHDALALDVDLHHAFTAKRFFVAHPLVLPCEPVGVDCDGQDVPTLGMEAQLLVALVNGAKERWRGLARVFDTAALAGRPELDWDRLASLCPADYRRVMDVGLSLVGELTGCPLPDRLAGRNSHLPYCRRLIDDRFGGDGPRAPRFLSALWSSAEFKWRLSVRAADHGRVLTDVATALTRLLRERAPGQPA